jgi:hypothetical protein
LPITAGTSSLDLVVGKTAPVPRIQRKYFKGDDRTVFPMDFFFRDAKNIGKLPYSPSGEKPDSQEAWGSPKLSA